MKRRLQRFRNFVLLAVGFGCAVLGLIGYGFDLLRRSELDTVDARFSLRGEKAPPSDIIVVAIDEATFRQLNLQWPFPRSIHGRVIRRIDRDRPKAIAYDVQFSEPTTLQGVVPGAQENRSLLESIGIEEDNALIKAVRSRAGQGGAGYDGEAGIRVRGTPVTRSRRSSAGQRQFAQRPWWLHPSLPLLGGRP